MGLAYLLLFFGLCNFLFSVSNTESHIFRFGEKVSEKSFKNGDILEIHDVTWDLSKPIWDRVLGFNLSSIKIVSDEAGYLGRLVELLEANQMKVSSCSKIILKSDNISDQEICDFAAKVLRNFGVNHFEIWGSVRDKGILGISDVMPRSKLEFLQLVSDDITDIGVGALGKALKDSNLEKLVIFSEQIGDEGAIEIAKSLPHSPLSLLALHGGKLNDRGIKAIAESLPESQLTVFEFIAGRIGDIGETALRDNIKKSQVQEFYIRTGNGDIESVKHVQMYRNMQSIANDTERRVAIFHNLKKAYYEGDYESVLRLARQSDRIVGWALKIVRDSGLKFTKKVILEKRQELDLSGLILDHEDFHRILQTRAKGTKSNLKFLNVSDCSLSDRDLRALFSSLSRSKITALDVSRNVISDETALFISEIWKKKANRLKSVWFTFCGISDAGAQRIFDVLPFTRLRTLDLSQNLVADGAIERLSSKLPYSSLEELYLLSCNQITVDGVTFLKQSIPDSQINRLCLVSNALEDGKELLFQGKHYFQNANQTRSFKKNSNLRKMSLAPMNKGRTHDKHLIDPYVMEKVIALPLNATTANASPMKSLSILLVLYLLAIV